MKEDLLALGASILIIIMVVVCVGSHFRGKCVGFSEGFERGVSNTHKEAFEYGLMVKEITKDDKVIYRWIDTHKLGYEE